MTERPTRSAAPSGRSCRPDERSAAAASGGSIHMRSCTVKGGALELAGLACGSGGGTGGVSELVSATKSSSCDDERCGGRGAAGWGRGGEGLAGGGGGGGGSSCAGVVQRGASTLKATQRCAFCPSTSTSGGSLCGGLGRRAAPPSSATCAGVGAVAGLSTPGSRRAAQPPAPPVLLIRPERRGGSAPVSAWRGSRCCHLPRHDGRRRRAARGGEGGRGR